MIKLLNLELINKEKKNSYLVEFVASADERMKTKGSGKIFF